MKTVKIDPRTLEDFIWMSYRYCIGRKTIAASMHADNIARIIKHNPNIFSNAKLEQFAGDIMDELRRLFTVKADVSIKGFGDKDNPYDWLSELFYSSNKVDNKYDYKYIINLDNRSVDIELLPEDVKNRHPDRFDYIYYDIIGWYKLAKLLDKRTHKLLICEWEDEDGKHHQEKLICISYPSLTLDSKYAECWMSIDEVSLSNNRFVTPEYIKEIKDL
jgi:hypothetical protein